MSLYVAEPLGSALFVPASWFKRLLALHHSLSVRTAWLGGVDAATGAAGERALYWGEGESLSFLHSLYGGQRRPGPHVSWSKLGALAQADDRDFVLYAEVNRFCTWLLPRGGYSTQPWIRQRVPLSAGTRFDSRAVEDVYGRRVRRYGYQATFCRNADAVVEFFHRMYRPYIEHRYGDQARLRRLRTLSVAQRSGFLLKIEERGEWVGGAVCRVRGGEVRLVALAVAPPFDDRLRRGALSAVYYFLIPWARQQGLHWVDMLRSRPHVQDGVYEHKRRFGAKPYADPWPHTTIRIYPPRAQSVKGIAGGFLVWTRSGFVPLAQVESERAAGACRSV